MKMKHLICLSLIFPVAPIMAQEKSAILLDPEIASFDDLVLENEQYWNGSDGTGGFVSGPAFFYNSYHPDWFSWSGWSYSNLSDNTTPGWGNQYSAITGTGRYSESGSNYGISYASPPSGIVFTDGSAHEVAGFYVTNATYTALSMRDGDDFSKKFGGVDGTDEDWLKLTVTGHYRGDSASAAEYYLADFTSANSEEDYIVENWEWFDLTGLGKIDSLSFSMSSTDNGDWGMNTPAYFAIDDLSVIPDLSPTVSNSLEDVSDEVGKQLEMNLTGVFTDEDDDDTQLVISLKSNSDETVTLASVEGMTLTLDLQAAGSSVLTLEAVSNNKSVEETMVVSVIATGLEEGLTESFLVYPNPSTGIFRISASHAAILEVSFFDHTGRCLGFIPDYIQGSQLDLTQYPSGSYILQIKSETGIMRETIIKQ